MAAPGFRIVIDCSVIIGAWLPDELDDYATHVIEQIEWNRAVVFAPVIFYLEVTNVLLNAMRKKRINQAQFEHYQRLIQIMPMTIDTYSSSPASIVDITQSAVASGLTIYDAAYLELAIRRKCPIATLDRALIEASKHFNLYYS